MNHVLLMAGGAGTRFGESLPKQYTPIDGKPIMWYVVERYLEIPEIDSLTIVTNARYRELVEETAVKYGYSPKLQITNGGDSRSVSVLRGLQALVEKACPDDVVLIHDATHPYLDKNGVLEVIEATKKWGGATLASFEYDTCYMMDMDYFIQNVTPRRNLAVGASPEAFLFGTIYEIYDNASKEDLDKMTSAGAIAIENGIEMQVIETDVLNLKITYKRDMELFMKLYKNYFFNEK